LTLDLDTLQEAETMRRLRAIEYITPLREGGSLPAVVRAEDGALYALKFAGAGQGTKALIAELIGGEVARALGFRVPEIVLLELDPAIGRGEPDPEIQDLLVASAGLNLGMRFLPHASRFSVLTGPQPSGTFASRLVWLDAYLTNVDRTARNVNMLVHEGEIWLIDHGACLYFHHRWGDYLRQSETPFPLIREHVLLPLADRLREVDGPMRAQLDRGVLARIVAHVPEAWLGWGHGIASQDRSGAGPAMVAHEDLGNAEYLRRAYVDYLTHRLAKADAFVEEADAARTRIL
jgi:hypothetical protein